MHTIYDLLVSKLSDGELSELRSAVYEENNRRMQSRVHLMPAMLDSERVVATGSKFEAVRMYNDRTRIGLSESKAVIEHYLST